MLRWRCHWLVGVALRRKAHLVGLPRDEVCDFAPRCLCVGSAESKQPRGCSRGHRPLSQELYYRNRVFGPLLFVAFMVVNMWILLSTFVTILAAAYGEVKQMDDDARERGAPPVELSAVPIGSTPADGRCTFSRQLCTALCRRKPVCLPRTQRLPITTERGCSVLRRRTGAVLRSVQCRGCADNTRAVSRGCESPAAARL